MRDAGLRLDEIDTPAVLVEHAALLANVRWAQTVANRHRVALRPHIKTHKCFEIARLQLAEGAIGITASKPEEAARFINGGFKSITVAYPIIAPSKAAALFGAARANDLELRVIVDSLVGLAAIATAAKNAGYKPGVFVKVDVGLHRVGVGADSELLLQLARDIEAHESLRFVGLLSHAGHAYAAADAAEVQTIATQEAALLQQAATRLREIGIAVREISVGSTPTALVSDCYECITEIRPGNYVFMDRTPLRLGLISAERIALSVLATVVSTNARYAIIDAGSKVLSSDRGAHGTTGAGGFGLAFPAHRYLDDEWPFEIEKLSEEHAFIRQPAMPLDLGTRVRIIPNHSCAVVNLTNELLVTRGDEVIARWAVAARGAVH